MDKAFNALLAIVGIAVLVIGIRASMGTAEFAFYLSLIGM